MLPKHLKNAIENWNKGEKRFLPSVQDEFAKVTKKHKKGELTEDEYIRELEVLNLRKQIGAKPEGGWVFDRNPLCDRDRYKIRKRVNQGLQDLLFVLENLEELTPDKSQGKPVIDPELMDKICALWLKNLRKRQWMLHKDPISLNLSSSQLLGCFDAISKTIGIILDKNGVFLAPDLRPLSNLTKEEIDNLTGLGLPTYFEYKGNPRLRYRSRSD